MGSVLFDFIIPVKNFRGRLPKKVWNQKRSLGLFRTTLDFDRKVLQNKMKVSKIGNISDRLYDFSHFWHKSPTNFGPLTTKFFVNANPNPNSKF